MKPILYQSTETEFDTNGIGILGDAISCTIEQERNGMYEMELEYPVTGVHYGDIALRSLLLAPPDPTSQPQPFRVYEITRPMNGAVTVYARHVAYDLAGIPVSPFSTTSAAGAMAGLGTHAAVDCPFEFWTDKTTAANMTVAVPTAIWSLLGGSEGGVLDVYGGEYEFDRFTVKLHKERGENRGVTIRYGKNMTDLKQEENCEAVYTGVYPYFADADGNVTELPEKIVNASGNFDFTRIMPLDLSSEWEEAPTEEQLRSRAETYITANSIGVPKVSLTVSFVQLEQSGEYKNLALLERVSLCDTVQVEFPRLGVSAEAKVTKTKYDVLAGRYESVELGNARTNLADTILAQGETARQESRDTRSYLQKAVDSATKQITGNAGGYVVLHSSTGEAVPDEILIMDTPDIQTAVKVWRWNKAGLGYSGTGYNGPYALAMTQDGAIVADFVTAGTMTANLIRAGLLTDATGTNYWNLETGEFSLSSGITVGGQTVGDIAEAAADAAVDAQTQSDIFNVLTNNGQTQGIYLQDGKVYLNGTYLKTGTLDANLIRAGLLTDAAGTNYWNLDTGEFSLSSGITVGGQTVGDIADAAADAAVDAQTQEDIFNILTNDGETQGIYLSGGKLYINGTYMKIGKISSKNGLVYFDLEKNEIHCDTLVSTSGSSSIVRVGTAYQGGTTGTSSGGGYSVTGVLIHSTSTPQYSIALVPGDSDSTPDLIRSGKNGMKIQGIVQQGGGSRDSGRAGMTITPNGYTMICGQQSSDSFMGSDYVEGGGSVQGMIIIEPYYTGDGTTYSSAGGILLKGNVTCNRTITSVGLSVTGTKSRIAKTDHFQDRLLYCYEMPSPMFGDIGAGVTDETGVCYVYLDPVFQETVASSCEYCVFLQKEGEGDLWVEEKAEDYFLVRGTENLPFSWEVKAKQRGYEYERLEMQNNDGGDAGMDYSILAATYLENYEKEILEV